MCRHPIPLLYVGARRREPREAEAVADLLDGGAAASHHVVAHVLPRPHHRGHPAAKCIQ